MMKTRGMTNRRRIAALDFDSFFVNRNSRYRGNHFDKKYEKNKLL